MQSILNRVAHENHVHPQFLEFVGLQDESATVGRRLFLFNIQDQAHPKYKSTVAFSQGVSIRKDHQWGNQ